MALISHPHPERYYTQKMLNLSLSVGAELLVGIKLIHILLLVFHDLKYHHRYLRILLNQAKMHSYFTPGILGIALLIGVSFNP